MPDDGLSVGETLLVASIPAAIALLGVIVATLVGQRWAAKAWREERTERQADRDHQADLERVRFLRAERLSVYRRLIDSCGEVLLQSALAIVPGSNDPESDAILGKADAAWNAALAEVQLVGASPVVSAAQSIREMRDRRRVDEVMRRYSEPDGTASERWQQLSEDEQQARLRRFEELFEENRERLAALTDECRRDIAATGG